MGEARPSILPRVLSGTFDDHFSTMAFIGGGKMYRLARERLGTISDVLVKETPFGCSTPILFMEHGERRFFLVPRHGEREYRVTAPFVNYRANIWALKELGVERLVAWTGPGTLSTRFRIGDLVLPDDLIDMTRHRATTFFENKGIGILRQSPAFCPTLCLALAQVLTEMALNPVRGAVYVVSEGPRLETRAEARALRSMGGDLVGMTLAPEAFLARELEMCYHPVAYVTAWAEGVVEDGDAAERAGSEEERQTRIDETLQLMPEIIWNLLELLPTTAWACSCQDSMLRYKKRKIISDDFHDWI
jgi:5'-methylthioadenosine phosphorylase